MTYNWWYLPGCSPDKHNLIISLRLSVLICLMFISWPSDYAAFFLHHLIIVTMFTFRKGIAVDRLVGFQDLGGKDDFSTKTLEALLIKKGNAFVQCVLHFLACHNILSTIIVQVFLLRRKKMQMRRMMVIMKIGAGQWDPLWILILILTEKWKNCRFSILILSSGHLGRPGVGEVSRYWENLRCF